MRILVRYVLVDLLKVFFLALTALTVLVFVVLLGNEAVDKGLGLGPLLRVTPYLMPQALQFTVPAAMLLAAANVFGRMSSYNEIIAVKALGISPMKLIWPVIVLATIVSFGEVVLNDVAVSWGQAGLERVGLESLEEVAYSQLDMRHTYNVGPVNITVRDVDGKKLIRPIVVKAATDDQPAMTLTADEAELSVFPDEGKILIVCRNVVIDGPFVAVNPDEFSIPIWLDGFGNGSQRSRSPSHLALREIAPAIDDESRRVSQIEQGMTGDATFAMLTGNFDALSDTAWGGHERALNSSQNRLHRLHTEPWRRWANGFSCLCFVLIGVPVAIYLRYSDFLASFFACFLPILVVYYPLLMGAVGQAKDGTVPPPTVWLGNIVLALCGVWLTRRVVRQGTVPQSLIVAWSVLRWVFGYWLVALLAYVFGRRRLAAG